MEKKGMIVEGYEVNANTIAIVPIIYGNRLFSKIYELEKECISPYKPIELMKRSCVSYGSTYEGRKMAAKKLIGIYHKVPIAISSFICLFPTTSPTNQHCIWIAYDHVVDYKKGPENGMTIVKFQNNYCIPLPISSCSFENQLIRTMMLKTKLTKSKNRCQQNTMYNSEEKSITSAERIEKYY